MMVGPLGAETVINRHHLSASGGLLGRVSLRVARQVFCSALLA